MMKRILSLFLGAVSFGTKGAYARGSSKDEEASFSFRGKRGYWSDKIGLSGTNGKDKVGKIKKAGNASVNDSEVLSVIKIAEENGNRVKVEQIGKDKFRVIVIDKEGNFKTYIFGGLGVLVLAAVGVCIYSRYQEKEKKKRESEQIEQLMNEGTKQRDNQIAYDILRADILAKRDERKLRESEQIEKLMNEKTKQRDNQIAYNILYADILAKRDERKLREREQVKKEQTLLFEKYYENVKKSYYSVSSYIVGNMSLFRNRIKLLLNKQKKIIFTVENYGKFELFNDYMFCGNDMITFTFSEFELSHDNAVNQYLDMIAALILYKESVKLGMKKIEDEDEDEDVTYSVVLDRLAKSYSFFDSSWKKKFRKLLRDNWRRSSFYNRN